MRQRKEVQITYGQAIAGEFIRVRSFPGRPFGAVKIYNDGNFTYAINAKGELFCTAVKTSGVYSGIGKTQALMLIGFNDMGVFKKDKAVKVAQKLLEDKKARALAWDAQNLLREAKQIGLKLTAAQNKKLTSYARKAT